MIAPLGLITLACLGHQHCSVAHLVLAHSLRHLIGLPYWEGPDERPIPVLHELSPSRP